MSCVKCSFVVTAGFRPLSSPGRQRAIQAHVLEMPVYLVLPGLSQFLLQWLVVKSAREKAKPEVMPTFDSDIAGSVPQILIRSNISSGVQARQIESRSRYSRMSRIPSITLTQTRGYLLRPLPLDDRSVRGAQPQKWFSLTRLQRNRISVRHSTSSVQVWPARPARYGRTFRSTALLLARKPRLAALIVICRGQALYPSARPHLPVLSVVLF